MSHDLAELQKVRPTTVHKENEDDVLIYTERGAIPTYIPYALVECATHGDTDTLILNEYYEADQSSEVAQPGKMLFLRCIPRSLAVCDVESVAAVSRCVEEHYAREDDRWILRSQFMDEADQIILAKHFVHRTLHLTDSARHRLSNVLGKIVGLPRPEVLYVNMHIDTKNYFFYRKHHEHVPGIMILEVIRQAMYAQFYRYNSYTRQQISAGALTTFLR